MEFLLTGLIDYAGLFPPSALDMRTAVSNYATYRSGKHRSWLGRFVVNIARLDELDAALPPASPDPWRLSAILGADLDSGLLRIERFNRDHANTALIDTVELKVEQPADVERAIASIPKPLTPYLEIPIEDNPQALVAAIAQAGVRAKIRTGGITAEAFPSSASLARFLTQCAKRNVSFKATAGLHHPLRGTYRLTYEPDSAQARMHGFLNVFLGAAFARQGVPAQLIVELLDEESPEAFHFQGRCVKWRGHCLDNAAIAEARRCFAMSFGSCSFEEPVEDLRKLGLS